MQNFFLLNQIPLDVGKLVKFIKPFSGYGFGENMAKTYKELFTDYKDYKASPEQVPGVRSLLKLLSFKEGTAEAGVLKDALELELQKAGDMEVFIRPNPELLDKPEGAPQNVVPYVLRTRGKPAIQVLEAPVLEIVFLTKTGHITYFSMATAEYLRMIINIDSEAETLCDKSALDKLLEGF